MTEKVYLKSSTQLLELAQKSDVDDRVPASTFDSHMHGDDPYRHPTKDIDFPIESNVSHFDTLQEALNGIWSTGVIEGCIVTLSATTDAVDVSTGDVLLRRTNVEDGELVAQHAIAVDGLVIANHTEVLVYAEYQNAHTFPLIKTTSNFAEVEGNLRTVVALVSRHDNEIDIINRGQHNINHPYKNTSRLVDLGMQHVPGGSVVAKNAGALSFNITAGAFYLGVAKFAHNSFNSAISDTFTYWYESAENIWVKQEAHTLLSNSEYCDGNGLVPLNNGRWSVSWIYATTSDLGLHVHVLYGNHNDTDQLDAEQAPRPARVPQVLSGITAVLLGRAVIQESATEPFVISSIYAVEIDSAAATSHNFLGGLQGGAANEFFHLSSAELSKLTGGIITWMPIWAQAEYPSQTMTRDGEWTMMSNKITSDRPAPQSVGAKQYGVDPSSTFITGEDSSVVKMLHRFVLDKDQAGYLEAIKVRVPEWSLNSITRIIFTNVTTGHARLINNPVLNVDDWTTLVISSMILKEGTEFTIQFEYYNSSPINDVTGTWTSSLSLGEPASSEINVDSFNIPTVIEISHTDLDGAARGTELDGVVVDSIIRLYEVADVTRYVEVKVTGAPDLTSTTSTKYPVTLIDFGSNGLVRDNKIVDVNLNVPITQPSVFNKITDHFSTFQPDFATVTSELYYDGLQQASLDDAYGIDVVFQQAHLSNDWDLVAVSNGDGGGDERVTKEFVEEAIINSTYLGKNLIVNGDFSVWQRGDVFTINAGQTSYTTDRVECYTASSSIFPYKDHDGLVFQGQTGNTTVAFSTKIEADTSKHLIDKESILSVYINAYDTINNVVIQIHHANALNDWSGKTLVATSTSTLSAGKKMLSLLVPANTNFSNGLQVTLGFNDGVTSGYVTLENMQLELGNQVTEPEIVNPTDQFVKCQRYYRKLGGLMGVLSTFEPTAHFSYDWNTMFAVPSVSIVGSPTGAVVINGHGIFDITTTSINSDRGLINIVTDVHSNDYGKSVTLKANILALSAEI